MSPELLAVSPELLVVSPELLVSPELRLFNVDDNEHVVSAAKIEESDEDGEDSIVGNENEQN